MAKAAKTDAPAPEATHPDPLGDAARRLGTDDPAAVQLARADYFGNRLDAHLRTLEEIGPDPDVQPESRRASLAAIDSHLAASLVACLSASASARSRLKALGLPAPEACDRIDAALSGLLAPSKAPSA